ncbi:hypothetical protein TNCV_4553571 [Trichonephila clavipes]|nr:hypothetical protein TNCV_4553571 [Trichonephila clavipes]
MIQQFFLPTLQERDLENVWLQDEATAHTSRVSIGVTRHPETRTRRKDLRTDENTNFFREFSENESDGGELSCSNLDSDENVWHRTDIAQHYCSKQICDSKCFATNQGSNKLDET